MSSVSRATRPHPFPRGALYGAAALIAFTFALALYSRITGSKMDWVPDADIVAARDIRFTSDDTGAVVIHDARSGALLGSFPHETNAFVRSVSHGLLMERKLAGGQTDTPFRIVRWSDGRVTVADPSSGRFVELGAFGQQQVQTFSKLLN